jgi:predicted glycosyltransferase
LKVWFDLTNSPHVLVLRPLIEALRADGAEVAVTARDFAQTVALCERFGIDCEVIGRHRGAKLGAKAVGLADRSLALARYARGRGFDLAIGHGSQDVTVAALAQRIPRKKLQPYAGLKEEYYLSDFEADPAVLAELGVDGTQPLVVVRTPPSVSLYHRFENDLFGSVLLALRDQAQVVVLPRVAEQRAELQRAGGFTIPERAIDAQSLIAFSDLVVSAGGTMNREAVALGTPVFTTFEGRLGAVDERLIAEGRMRKLESADEVHVVKRAPGSATDRIRRDPRDLLKLLTAPLQRR